MKQIYFIGIDVSKEKVDVAVINSSKEVIAEKILRNDRSKLVRYISTLMRKEHITAQEVLICCEDTGIYSKPLKEICHQQGWLLWVENAFKIKKATTDVRGKSDKKDALRIAEYALRYQDRQRLYVESNSEQSKLQTLLGARETILDQITRLKQQLSESKDFDPFKHKVLTNCYKKSLRTLESEFKVLEAQIKLLVEQSEELSSTVNLLKSIPGVGLQSALNFIVYTKNFTMFNSSAHLACYAGVVPFPNQSGGMHKRDRISSFANKKLKKLLHMAAMAATKVNGEIKQYYIRKVKEGKNKMSVLNAIRNKLVKRMFAVIQRKSPYLPIQEENLVFN
jgi:transposase